MIAFSVAFLLMASSILYALVWIPKRLLGRLDGGRPVVSARAGPLASVLLAIGFVVVAMKWGLSGGGRFGPASAAVTALSIAFPIVGMFAMVRIAALPKGAVSTGVRRYGIAVALACVGVAVWFAAYGFIGLRTWVY